MVLSYHRNLCAAIIQLKRKVTMLFITHALPKNLQVDEIMQIGIVRPSSESNLGALEIVGAPA
jgi:ABC-type transport system involved in cytochrome bd biosynthesis fused ATPase/permease subunit